MNNPAGLQKNKIVDLAALAFVAAGLGLTPFVVDQLHTAPPKGPDNNPTILVMFLLFLGSIVLVSLIGVGATFLNSLKDPNKDSLLTPYGLNYFNILSKILAGLFLVSGFVKLQDPIGFSYKLDDYWTFFQGKADFFPATLMHSFSVPISGFVSVFEVALGFALITGYRMRQTAWFLLLMLLFFTVLTGLAAFTGELQDCGCFGDALKLEPWQTFVKDLLLLIPGFLIFMHRGRIHPYYRKPMPGFLSIGTFTLGAALSVYCFYHLELLDFRGAYKVGQNLCYNASNTSPEGEIFAHDFTEFGQECGLDGCTQPMLYIVMYDMEDHPLEHYNAAGALAQQILEKAPGIQVAGGSSTSTSVRKKMDLKFPENFCWSGQDQKVLRTMIRSSPGFILLKDGVVQQKWHYNDMPTVDKLIELVGPNALIAPIDPNLENPVLDTTGKIDSLQPEPIQ